MGLDQLKTKVLSGNYKLTPEEKTEFQLAYNEVRLSNNKKIKQLNWGCDGCISTAYLVVKNYWNKTTPPVEITKAKANVKTFTISADDDDSGVEKIQLTEAPGKEAITFSKKPGRKPKK